MTRYFDSALSDAAGQKFGARTPFLPNSSLVEVSVQCYIGNYLHNYYMEKWEKVEAMGVLSL